MSNFSRTVLLSSYTTLPAMFLNANSKHICWLLSSLFALELCFVENVLFKLIRKYTHLYN